MTTKARSVAVIGAGPAGAIATDALVKEQAFDKIRVFDRRSVAGGTWVYTPDLVHRVPSFRDLIDNRADLPVPVPSQFPCETPISDKLSSHQLRYSDNGVHASLHSNLPPSTMSFTQEPLPEILSEQTLRRYGDGAPFRHWPIIREWVEQIFTRGGHDKLVEFNTTVERVEKVDTKWVLTLRKGKPGEDTDRWWQETFDGVVVATGHYNIPYIPDIPGLAEYEDRFPGSTRHSKHYRSAEEFRDKRVIVVGGSVSAFDALHEIRTLSRHPVIAALSEPLPAFGWAPFTHPHIERRPPIVRFDPETKRIDFADGSSVDDIDVVLFATGYNFSFPFLSDVDTTDRRIHNLYQHVFNITDPTLTFIGMVSGGLTFRVFEWQAVAAARFLAGRATLPSTREMEHWEAERLAEKGGGIPFSNIASDYEGYFEALRSLAGEPATGTKGRVLPPFDRQWPEEFLRIVDARVAWWQKEKREEEERAQRREVSSLNPVDRAREKL